MWRKQRLLTFDAHVCEKEGRAQPSDLGFQSFFGAATGSFGIARMFGAVDMAGFGPEGRTQSYKFQD